MKTSLMRIVLRLSQDPQAMCMVVFPVGCGFGMGILDRKVFINHIGRMFDLSKKSDPHHSYLEPTGF